MHPKRTPDVWRFPDKLTAIVLNGRNRLFQSFTHIWTNKTASSFITIPIKLPITKLPITDVFLQNFTLENCLIKVKWVETPERPF